MKTIDPLNASVPYVHQTLLGAVGPRPIAFASTIDQKGNPNLSPFSFFNAFGANPATLVFSPSRRGRDNTTKDTLENLKEVPEVVINAVTFSMVQQMSLASTEYPRGVNEFIKSGLTPVPSERIKPFRVKESPVHFECTVRDIIETGNQGGAGNLVICNVLLIHLEDSVLDENERIDPRKIDLVGRLGGDYYCRANGESLFVVEKPLQKPGIGIDSLPDKIKHSKYLTGNDLGRLGNIESLPSQDEIDRFKTEFPADKSFEIQNDRDKRERAITGIAQKYLENNQVREAIRVLLGYL
jgi:flavin reductase (DIM6/NTAB) family NADH-FMN oxidoreductase RutF